MSEKVIEQTFWKKTKRFFEPVLWRKKIYAKFIIQSLFIPISGVVSILFLEQITFTIQGGDISSAKSYLIGFLVFILFWELLIYVTKNWGWMITLYKTRDDLYKTYLSKFVILDNTRTEKIGSGKLVGVIHDGISKWSEVLADFIATAGALLVGIFFTIYMVGRIHYFLPIIFILLIVLFCFITLFMNRKLMKFRSERYEYKNLVLKDFIKIISSKVEILQAGKLDKNLERMSFYLSQGSRISQAMSPYRTINKRSAPFMLNIGLLTLFMYIIFVFNSEFELSFLVGLSGTFVLMQRLVFRFVSFYVDLNKQMVFVEKLWTFFDTTPQITGYEEGNTFEHKSGKIELKNLSYGYDENKKIFQNFDLEIPGNKITALVGPSGGGKSTLVKLISGYIRQDSGEIIIDDQKLSETSLKSYYADVGYLTQEPSVFDGTVKENLLYAVTEESTKEQIEEIISLAHCDFIYDLPNGIDTEIGERGVKLSGGQKQRLAIAKIFIKDPKIIILDEPTSALDSLSEQKITEAMHNLFQDRTVLVIAHRLQTVKHADDIIVIEDGEIKERGTHVILVEKNGFYKQMLDLQSGF